MRLSPTPEQFTAIMEVLPMIEDENGHFDWGTPENKARALKLCFDLSGYRPSQGCIGCWNRATDILKIAVGLPPKGKPVSDDRYAARMAICHACTSYVSSSRSCGPLGLGAIFGGAQVCGCFLPIKARMKNTTCPQAKW